MLEQAGLQTADALLAISDDDELNLGTALHAREKRPSLRLVLRQFNLRLGQLLESYLPDAHILSLSAAAAPTFALAALGPGVVFAHETGGDVLVLREIDGAQAGPQERARALLSLEDGQLLVASRGRELPVHPPRPPVQVLRQPPPASGEVENRRLLALTVLALACVLASVSALFAWRLGLAPLDALYFVSTILTTVGFGDFNLRDADPVSKVVGVLAMYAGLLLSAILVALSTNRLLSRQEGRRRGHFRQPLVGHVVVCGLGTMGLRIALALRRLGQPVVALDPGARPAFAAALREAGVPLVEGDGGDERALGHANLAQARALVVATSRDHRNLEMALVARSLVPGLPVVLRLFDPDLCRRAAATFGIEATFSGASLGAGLFASVADHGTRLASLRLGGTFHALHRLEVAVAASVGDVSAALQGTPVAACDAAGALRLAPGAEDVLVAGTSLYVLVREGPAGGQA